MATKTKVGVKKAGPVSQAVRVKRTRQPKPVKEKLKSESSSES